MDFGCLEVVIACGGEAECFEEDGELFGVLVGGDELGGDGHYLDEEDVAIFGDLDGIHSGRPWVALVSWLMRVGLQGAELFRAIALEQG